MENEQDSYFTLLFIYFLQSIRLKSSNRLIYFPKTYPLQNSTNQAIQNIINTSQMTKNSHNSSQPTITLKHHIKIGEGDVPRNDEKEKKGGKKRPREVGRVSGEHSLWSPNKEHLHH